MMMMMMMMTMMMIMRLVIIAELKGANGDFYSHLTARELSLTRTLQWSGGNRVQITCNTQRAYHVQHVCHVVRSDSSAVEFDRI